MPTPLHFQTRNIQGLSGGTMQLFDTDGTTQIGTSYVCPNLQALDVTHKAEYEEIPNQAGATGSLIITNEWIEITFDTIPQGTNDANARNSAAIPPAGATARITGLPIIRIGPFADGLNTNGASTQPWFYLGDGGLGGAAKEHWNGKITLRRYPAITTAAAVAAS